MSLTAADIKKIAHLARLNMSENSIDVYTRQLTNILNLVEQMSRADTDTLAPLAHSIEVSQRTREDLVTETNQRAAFQAIAPQVEVGLYLVPKVLDSE